MAVATTNTNCKKVIDLNVFDPNDVKKSLNAIIDAFNQFNPAQKKFIKLFPEWEEKRAKSIAVLLEMADALDVHRSNCNISKTVGSSVSAAGCICAAVATTVMVTVASGGILAPVAIAGGAAAVAGGLTTAGTVIAETVIENSEAEKAKNTMTEDENYSNELFTLIQRSHELEEAVERLMAFDIFKKVLDFIKPFVENTGAIRHDETRGLPLALKEAIRNLRLSVGEQSRLGSLLTTILNSKECSQLVNIIIDLFRWVVPHIKKVFNVVGIVFGAFRVLDATSDIGSGVLSFTRVLSPAMRSAIAFGMVFSAVSLAIDIFTLVSTSRSIMGGSKSELATQFRQVAEYMQREYDNLQLIYKYFN